MYGTYNRDKIKQQNDKFWTILLIYTINKLIYNI